VASAHYDKNAKNPRARCLATYSAKPCDRAAARKPRAALLLAGLSRRWVRRYLYS